MTRVRLLYLNDGLTPCGYTVTGHTGYAEEGHDIVCAAVSFLSITCANALETVAGIRPDIAQQEGRLEVRIQAKDLNAKAGTILSVLIQGMSDLTAAYPSNVEFNP
jgi:uncharacterized protein YsxB (DUF464 family)